ncbi:hypothetical protein AAF712_009667 [Marasmius tenuissimus]|uniref:Uncharacterized protein n=1 Tax=Marasmius tenuissimus TaxID=585030 RepID=A0ABR2ZQ22_9AGAR
MSSQPIVDPHNPLYCPSIPANMYLSQVLHPIRNQRPKSQANKMNLNILTSSRIRKGSTRNSGSISSFVRMLHHWHDSVLRSKEKEGLASNSNDCMDFGPPRIVESMKNNSKTHHRMNNIVAASRSGPRTRAKSRAQTRNVDDGLPSKDHVVPSLTTSNPASPAVVMKKGAHRPSAVASSKSGSLIRPFWDISGSSDSTLASPTFSVAQVGNETELNILPPGLRSDQEHSGLVDTLLIHPTLTAPVTTKPKTMILKSLLRRAVPAITLSTRVQSDDTSQNYQCSIFDLKSRKRKLEELFPDLLIPSESSGTKRHKGIQINASPRGGSFNVQYSESDDDEDDVYDYALPRECFRDLFQDKQAAKELLSPRDGGNTESQKTSAEERIKSLEDALYGHPIGTESPRGYGILLEKLDTMMPGIRLRQRLSEATYSGDLLPFGNQPEGEDGLNWGGYMPVQGRGRIRERSHQGVADFLGEEGLLNERVMEILRTSEIRRLDMAPSLADEGGLNLGGRDTFKVFGKPNSFLFLSELTFSGSPVNDIDLLHIIRLPRLKRLWLENTDICDEAIYHLTGLRSTLCALSVANNPRITDDAIPALVLLNKLQFLSLAGTGIGMVGLRKLASVINGEKRVVDVEIPEKCEIYVANLETSAHYLLQIPPPLISVPSLCGQLSIGALKRNLEAHYAVAATRAPPPGLPPPLRLDRAGGSSSTATEVAAFLTKAEMKEKLEGILRMREVDLLVKGMVFG